MITETIVVPITGSTEDQSNDDCSFAIEVITVVLLICVIIYCIAHAVDQTIELDQ